MKSRITSLLAVCAGIVLLASCGGGGGTPAAATLQGTAATGAALAHAPVAITNSGGASPCTEATITTDSVGSYSCTLKGGETAPFFIVVTDPTGNTAPLVSISTTTPPAGSSLTVNATPLTTAIVAQLAGDGNALSMVGKTVDAAALKALTDNVLAQLAPVLQAIGMEAGYDPFTTRITAASAESAGNTADLVLDIVKVVTDPATGKLALSTIESPTPVLMASATSSGATLTQPSATVSTLGRALQLTAAKLNGCFALAPSQRALQKDISIPDNQGGPEVLEVAAQCQDFTASSQNAAGIEYLHNGYLAGQQFFGLLTSSSMTGAKFSAPEVMAFYPPVAGKTAPAPEAYDRAVVNLRFLDANGDPGNVITIAARIPNTASAARPTDWWLVGNQQEVDTAVRLNIRRVEQLNAQNADSGRMSTFQSGMQFMINPKGPGSVRGGQPMTFARVTGPGLPGNGLMYKVSGDTTLESMDLYDKNGALPAGITACNPTGPAFTNCPNIWFARTAGTSGSAAETLASNPGGFVWVQSGEATQFNPTKVVKGARYKIDLYYGANTTLTAPDVTVTKTLLSDLVLANRGVYLPWNTPGAQTLAALDPNGTLAGAQSALTVDWIQNVSAQQIGGVQSNNANGGYNGTKRVPRGAVSVVLDNQTVPAFADAKPLGSRTLLMGYRMSDNSSKTAVYQWN